MIGDVLDMLPVKIPGQYLRENLTEVRFRAGKRIQLTYTDDDILLEERTDERILAQIIAHMMEYSMYAWENELRVGYFTLSDGCRVGVCGRCAMNDGRIESIVHISSVCIRNAREIRGCAEPLRRILLKEAGSVLILAPPGMGKTTILRDAARLMSNLGMNVAIADERSELAACKNGIPAFDVGERTDVMDNCPKSIAMEQLIRACAPDVIVTDEMGNREDMAAAMDSVRCGVKLVASAHAGNLEDAVRRPVLGDMLTGGVFRYAVILGERPGNLKEIRELE